IEQINACGRRGAFVLSVDIPSGICADNGKILGGAVRADLTVTFAFAKRGHLLYPGREYTKELVVKDIGITQQSFGEEPPGAFCYERGDAVRLLPKRRPDGNKGSFGKVLLLAGSRDMGGACILCGRSILKAGAGMVKIITCSCNREIMQNAVPEAMLYTFDEAPDKEQVQKSMDWADVVVAGPGMGTDQNAYLLIKYVLREGKNPIVLDADALNLLAAHEELRMLAAGYGAERMIITPHPGELVRLAKTHMEEYQNHRETLMLELAKELSCIVAAKDAVTMVAQAGRREIYINTSGNDGMAGAGSGDVLAGVIGGLLAQKQEAFDAACLGVYLHGLAGEEASVKEGRRGMTASDIIKNLPIVMREA
ncbi:MAG: NAD(P)H-hydrate dehydratase, partial [Lachnospiraceae bacterium]|nr:NAD(P)H-hydrate dehydratase [Lachnospiraceae bacterium]